MNHTITGGCLCGDLRYEAPAQPQFQSQCYCRECQYISGGHPNAIIGLSARGLRYTQGQPTQFERPGKNLPAVREFCKRCGTHTLSRVPSFPDFVMVKVGTLDDPSIYQGSQSNAQLADAQAFHHIDPSVPGHQRWPASIKT
jgi:hypothetical protein